jgi:hypothetical protein
MWLVYTVLAIILFSLVFKLYTNLVIERHLSLKKEGGLEELPYRIKHRFFSRSELSFFHILDNTIDKGKYLIFPKVRLADFIDIVSEKDKYYHWFNKIKAKHVDYLIWDIKQHKIALAVELDGKSHESEKMKERDDFVNRIYKHVGIELERISVGTDFQNGADKICAVLSDNEKLHRMKKQVEKTEKEKSDFEFLLYNKMERQKARSFVIIFVLATAFLISLIF